MSEAELTFTSPLGEKRCTWFRRFTRRGHTPTILTTLHIGYSVKYEYGDWEGRRSIQPAMKCKHCGKVDFNMSLTIEPPDGVTDISDVEVTEA